MKCPYCAEEIQDEAIFCRYCKNPLEKKLVEQKSIVSILWGLPFIGVVRALDVYINGNYRGNLRFTKTIHIEEKPGHHTLVVKMGKWKSRPFNFQLKPGKLLLIDCGVKQQKIPVITALTGAKDVKKDDAFFFKITNEEILNLMKKYQQERN